MKRKMVLALALTASIGALAASPARAGMIADVANPEAGAAPFVEQAQIVIRVPGLSVGVGAPFFFGGRDYCWYDDAWNGPGWYWCGYGYRSGYGWGGPEGFNGWRGHRYERDWHAHGGPGPGPYRGGPGPGMHPHPCGPYPHPGATPTTGEHHS